MFAFFLAMLQAFETAIDEFKKLNSEGQTVQRAGGKVYPGRKIIGLLEKAEIRRDIREEISLLIDRIGQYLTHKGICAL